MNKDWIAAFLGAQLAAITACQSALAQDPRARSSNEPGYTAPRSYTNERSAPMEPAATFRGEVEGIDKAAGTITLKHGSIDVFGVPARTMDYAVKDSALLERVKVGERVRFNAVLQGRSLIVTNLAPAN